MTSVSAELRRFVIERAGDRCEYCQLPQVGQEATFHVDHVIPTKLGGQTADTNLALACVSCSLRKGARGNATDPDTNTPVNLYNPRTDNWSEHFQWDGVQLVGRTSVARATISLLRMNRSLVIEIRREEMALGRHPPSGPQT